MPTATQAKAALREPTAPPSLVGWHGVSFLVPPGWNITGFSPDRSDGYLKVDSPDAMFVQVKWSDQSAGARRPVTLGDMALAAWRRRRAASAITSPLNLRQSLDSFLKQTAKLMRRSRSGFDYKVKPETAEAGGERTAHHFSWTGGGQGQGKIWHCRSCGRTVVAQVVGQPRDNVASVAAQLFSSFRCHAEGGWEVWALYDLVAAVPDDFRLKSHLLMSGRLRLDFERSGGEKLRIERWGLANVTRKRFTLEEWLRQAAEAGQHRVEQTEAVVQDHPAAQADGSIRGAMRWLRALREAGLSLRPASRYEARCWECPETNKIYAIETWRKPHTNSLIDEVAMRCECH